MWKLISDMDSMKAICIYKAGCMLSTDIRSMGHAPYAPHPSYAGHAGLYAFMQGADDYPKSRRAVVLIYFVGVEYERTFYNVFRVQMPPPLPPTVTVRPNVSSTVCWPELTIGT